MSRSSSLILLGVFTIIAPFSGFPTAFRSLLAVICGACVMGIGLSVRTRQAPVVEAALPEEKPQKPHKSVSPI